MRYLCDTNIISEVMRREPVPEVLSWFQQQSVIALSVVSVEEIQCGLAFKQAPRQLEWFEEFCESCCSILPLIEPIAVHAGILRGQLRRSGHVRTQADIFIAATAAHHGLALATRNIADFDHCGIPLLNPFPS